jgi:methionyl-tRNA synthetase
MGTILYVTAEVVRQFAILAQPAMPESCNKLLDLMAVPADARTFGYLGAKGRLAGGTPIPEPQGVFPRYVDPAEAEAQAQQKAGMQAKLDAKAVAKKGKQS